MSDTDFDLNARLGIPKSLGELGVTDPDIDRIVKGALSDPSTGGMGAIEKRLTDWVMTCVNS